jgi:beta-phosphoglucomutase family hydrolase
MLFMKHMSLVDKKAKCLIFDLDGTLINTNPIHLKAWQAVMSKLGFDFTPAFFHKVAGMPTLKIAEMIRDSFGIKLDPEKVTEDKEEEFWKRADEIKTIDPVFDIVKQYKGIMPICVGTGAKRHIAIKILKDMNIYSYFDFIVSADDVVNPKPAPDTFLACSVKFGINPKDCQVFEDGELGLQAAASAKMIATDVKPLYDSAL